MLWTGQIEPLYTETYTFQTSTDDGVRLWVDGQLIIDKWLDQAATAHTGSIALVAGQKVDIRMDYYENAGGATAQLAWSSPSQALQIVPQSQLYSGDAEPEPEPHQFAGETIVDGLSSPTAIDFRLQRPNLHRAAEWRGARLENGQLLPTPFIDISCSGQLRARPRPDRHRSPS